MRDLAEVLGLPSGTHDAGVAVSRRAEQKVAEFMCGRVAQQIGEIPVGIVGQIADSFRV